MSTEALIEDIYELSPMQQGMLFHSLYGLEAWAGVVQVGCVLRGRLDQPAFEQTWRRLLQRHQILRTAFFWDDFEKPLQVVHREVELPLVRENFEGLGPAEQAAAVESFLRADRQRPFDISEAPLMRLTLLRLADDLHHFVWSFHHVLFDGWTSQLLFKEIFAMYDAASRGDELRMEPVRPFRDYIQWLQRQDLSASERHWRQLLAGFASPTPLPLNRASASAPEEGFADYGLLRGRFSEETTADLVALARRQRVTVNTLLLGAWGVLLSRYGGEGDVVFGTTASGRPADLPGVESMPGLFINTLPLRLRLNGREGLASWLRGIQAQQVEARQYEYTPLAQVKGWSDVPGNLPLFESLVIFENYPLSEASAGPRLALSISDISVHEQTPYPLTVVGALSGPQLSLQLSYDRKRFTEATVERIMRHLQGLLESFAADPERPLGELGLLEEAERRRILYEWNQTETAPDSNAQTVVELFTRQARRAPEAVALVYGSEEVKYGDLDTQSNRLARRLRGLGVGGGVAVGVCVERGPGMVAAVLAVLKAGGAYVPLDPGYPEDRLAFMIEDSGLSVLLTEESLLPQLPAGGSIAVVCIDSKRGEFWKRGTGPLAAGGTAEDLAYIIYTSGSTGRPKGVMLQHSGACNLALAEQSFLRLDASSRVLQFSSLSFDASVWEIFSTLAAGATLCLASRDDLMPGEPLADLLRRERITTATLPPSALSLLPAGDYPDLKVLVAAGEACTPDIVARWSPGRVFINAYGPTEVTVCASLNECDDPDEHAVIGRPIANARVYLLDRSLQPVPVGVAGELYVAGAGLARGYHGRPSLTAERFTPDPFGDVPGGRLYRTGDLARYLDDGRLEFVGRADQQVKLRGYRIEPGEIEALLSKHPAVREAVVVARADAGDAKILVAYVVPAEEQDEPEPSQGLNAVALRAYLKERLPEYMIPSAFVMLARLPLTANGKVDRAALPAPDEAGPAESEEDFQEPKSPTEELLAGIWAKVLGVERVSATLDFFAAGGHSLLATQVISRVREAFRVEITLRSLFDHPTVGGLARHIDELRAGESGNLIPPIGHASRAGELPLSFAQQRLYFLDQLKPGSTVYIVPTAVRLSGRLDVSALERSLSTIFERHESLRTTFANGKSGPVQVVQPAVPLRLSCVDLQEVPEGERETEARRLARLEARIPFDLSRDPLIRAQLLRLGPEDHVFLLTLHHIVSDVWSVGVLVREVAALYNAYARGEESPLPGLPVQYADYAIWQRGWLQGEVMDAQLAYWRRQLEGAPALLELPTDRPRPLVQSLRGASRSFRLPAALSQRLRELSRGENATLFMTLLTGFQALLYRYTGQTDIVVGTPVAGRNSVELEGLIGFFVNTLALRCQVEDGLSFRELLARCRETTLGAYVHQDVPFEKLVEELQPERTLGHAPLVQVVFALQNAPQEAMELPELRLGSLPQEDETAKFDLIFSLSDAPEGFALAVSYNRDILDGSTVAKMVEHYRNLLESAVADPEQRVGELKLLDEDERRHLLREWNRTEAASGSDAQTVAELFVRQARATPDAASVRFEGEELTYAELNTRANRLARYLLRLGVGPESKVGVMLHRGSGLVVSLLAVLKAGAAYVPLDPEYPQERLSILLEDSRPQAVIVDDSTYYYLPAHEGLNVNLDEDRAAVAREEASEPAANVTGDNAAYVCFTSGSTGRPKGVVVPHGALAARVRSMIETYGLRAGDRQLQFVSPSFDAFAEELYPSLCCGATLYMLPNPGALTPREMIDFCERMRLTALHIPVAFWHLMVEELSASGRRAPESVRIFITGGESPSPERVAQWLQATSPDALFVNAYGPTEATITATAYRVRKGVPESAPLTRVPIGRPIHDTQVYLLDARMEPVPVGVAGEIFIGGGGVTRGYLDDPGLTASKFVPDPFGTRPGARLYRTGDLARYLPDGQVEWLGRVDEQVKINGHRIDLGEVEATLLHYGSVRACAVMAREDRPGDKKLVAYVAADNADASALRDFMREKLPEYVVPSAFVILEELPLTANGKVDRKALPAPREAATAASADGADARPQSQVATILVSIWKDLLDVETVEPGADFFALGGHSLLAVRLMARINDHFGVELPLSTLFQGATVEQLEEVICEQSETQVWTHLAPINTNGTRPPFFCVHPAGGQVLCYAQLAQLLGPDQPFYGLEALDFVGVGEQGDDYRTIEERAAAYVAAAKVVQPEGPYRLGGWSYGGIIAYEMARQLREQGQEVVLLAVMDSPAPLISQRIDDAQLLVGFALEVAAQAGREVELERKHLDGLSPDEQLEHVVGLMMQAGVLPADVDGERVQEQARAVLRGSKIRSQSIADYEPQPYDGTVTVFAADINPGWAQEESVGELVAIYTEPTKGWSRLSTQPVRVIPVPGYHSTILQEPHVSVLAERLDTCLAEVAGEA